MPFISLNSVLFQYHSSAEPVFTNLNLTIETQWKSGVVGRNGRGKSTLLALIHGTLEPIRGSMERPGRIALFPLPVHDTSLSVIEQIKIQIAPFRRWEKEMEQLLRGGTENDLRRYGEIAEEYERNNGFTIDALIERECAELGLTPAMLHRPYSSLSGGEQTRSMIAALFLRQGAFPLLDEPTNHLDMNGRSALAEYLSRKSGFIVVSHDRSFLDRCCDHIISLNRNEIRIFPGNYSSWHAQAVLEEETERAKNENLTREIEALEIAARQRRTWSAITEKEKSKAADSGFVSHKAAKIMKRALSIERRIEKNIEEKKTLLTNVETVRPLTMEEPAGSPEIVLSVENVSIEINGAIVVENLSFTLRRGQRIALIGDNGSGKTSVLRMLRGELRPVAGQFRIPGFLDVANGYQHPCWGAGMLREHLRMNRVNETHFRTIMGSFNVCGDIFDRPLETFSRGELKKVDLCRSFLKPHHLLLWDEPVNYIDIPSREQIERMLLSDKPTMLFTEHDRTFVERVATQTICLPSKRR
ncbi:MAG: ribosomal protection-like ABC-F family protein [Bacteroidota bacterium]